MLTVMKKIIPIVLLAALGCSMMGCTTATEDKANKEQTEQAEQAAEIVYKFVMVRQDGSELVEDLKAKNDTDALALYIERMEKTVVANIDKEVPPYKEMFVVSPEGDTLNTNEELLKVVTEKSTNGQQTVATPLK